MLSDVSVLKYLAYLRANNVRLYIDKEKIKYETIGDIDIDFISKFKEYIGKNKEQFTRVLKKIDDGIELNSIQKSYIVGLDTGCELGGINCAYYIEYIIKNIDINKLEKIVNELIFENEGLRCFFINIDKYVIFDTFDIYKIKSIDNSLKGIEIRNLIFDKHYSYYDWPLFDFYVYKGIDGDDRLYFMFNCIILDSWSASNFIKKIFDRYFFDRYEESKSISYSDYKRKENLYLSNLNKDAYYEYLANEMKKYSIPNLKYKKDYSKIENTTFERISYRFGVDETREMFEILKIYRYTPTMYIATCYTSYLAKVSNQDSVSIVLTVNGRKNIAKNETDIIGEFSNIAVLNYEKDKDFGDDLKNIRNAIWDILDFIEYDGIESFKYIAQNRLGKTISPFVLTSVVEENSIGELATEVYSISKTPQVIIDHHIRLIEGSLVISWDYVEELFEKEYIEKIFNDYIEFINNMKSKIF